MIGPGGSATLDSNNIKNTGADGIVVTDNSSAIITNNTIENNPDRGICVEQ